MEGEDRKNWLGFLEGDQVAFSELYLKYHPKLLRYGIRLVNDEIEAEDCVQELFCYLYEKRSQLSIVTKVQPYIFLSYRRRLLQKVAENRSADAKKMVTEEIMQLSREELIINAENEKELRMYMSSILKEITPNQREVIYLRYYAELTNKEIAQVLSMRHQSVLNILYRTFKTLRRLVTRRSSTRNY